MYNVAAIVLARGHAGPGEYNQAALEDPTIASLRNLIELAGDPETIQGAGSLHAELQDGQEINITIEHALGTKEQPLDNSALHRKLVDAATGILDSARIETLATTLDHLDDLDDLATVMTMVAK